MHLAQLDLLPGLRGCEDTGVQNAGHSEGPTDDGTDLEGGGVVRGQCWLQRQASSLPDHETMSYGSTDALPHD